VGRKYAWVGLAVLVVAGADCALIEGLGGDATLTAPDGGSSTGTGSGGGLGSQANGEACTADMQCASAHCSDDGQGSSICCASACMGNLACAPGGMCNSTCTSNTDCAAGNVCTSSGTCLPSIGKPCMMASQCASNFCVDGVCCDSACDTACQACSAALNGETNGTCGSVPSSSVDPRGMCAVTASTSCATNGGCLAGTCTYWPPGGVCAPYMCSTVTNETVLQVCNGMGSCSLNNAPSVMCGSLGCSTDDTSCACAKNSDCPASVPFCNVNNACEP
jgi:hypothetical protein